MANLRTEQYAGSQSSHLTDLPSYISGYVDGEGCFTVSISPRPTLRVGWRWRPSLSVSQNGDRDEVLLAIQDHFGCGTIRPDRSDKTLKWEVRSLPLLIERVIPHFHRFRCARARATTSSCSPPVARRWRAVSISNPRACLRLCDGPAQ